jgi:DNA-binding FadR family transcriptional regulator
METNTAAQEAQDKQLSQNALIADGPYFGMVSDPKAMTSVFRPITTRLAFEAALDQLTEAIRMGDLRVGDRLPTERGLASVMGISRPTLREATKLLVDAGVLDVRRGPQGGTFVRNDHIPRALLAEQSQLRLSEITDVLHARRLLEPRVAQLAGVHATSEDFDAMQLTIDQQQEVASDRDRFVQCDIRFHLGIARATRNSMLVELMHTLLTRLDIARDMAMRDSHDPERAIEIHVETLAALKSRDMSAIAVAMDRHLAFLESFWQDEAGRALSQPLPETITDFAFDTTALHD